MKAFSYVATMFVLRQVLGPVPPSAAHSEHLGPLPDAQLADFAGLPCSTPSLPSGAFFSGCQLDGIAGLAGPTYGSGMTCNIACANDTTTGRISVPQQITCDRGQWSNSTIACKSKDARSSSFWIKLNVLSRDLLAASMP